MSDTNCPYCGEPEETDTPTGITIYRCGTLIYPNGSSVTPLICDLGRDLRREREAHNQTKRERDELLKEHSTLRDIADRAVKNIREARNLSVIGDWREIDIIQEKLRSELDQLK